MAGDAQPTLLRTVVATLSIDSQHDPLLNHDHPWTAHLDMLSQRLLRETAVAVALAEGAAEIEYGAKLEEQASPPLMPAHTSPTKKLKPDRAQP